jgi:glycerol kinase
VWASAAEVKAQWAADASFTPLEDRSSSLAEWQRAVERSRGWAQA